MIKPEFGRWCLILMLWKNHLNFWKDLNIHSKSSALQEKDLGILQILASMNINPNKGRFMYGYRTSDIAIAAKEGNLNVIKILAPITKYPNSGNLTYQSESGYQTPMHEAAYEGHLDVLKFLMIRNSMFPQMDLLHFIVLPKEDILMYSKFWLQ